jgi:hypothetical protein
MSGTTATKTAKPGRNNPVKITGKSYVPRSRRGLDYHLVVGRCPFCGHDHVFRDAGLRVAGCGGGYIYITAPAGMAA